MQKNTLLYKVQSLADILLYIVTTILMIRFVFKLLGANPAAEFTQFVYALSAPLMAPFQFVFTADAVNGAVFEWSVLLALVVYWAVVQAFNMLIATTADMDERTASKRLEANA